jgi:hypothetical protein
MAHAESVGVDILILKEAKPEYTKVQQLHYFLQWKLDSSLSPTTNG